MKFVLASKSGRDRDNRAPTSERLVNLYAAPNADGSRSRFSLRAVPGTRTFATTPGPFLRAMREVEGTLYAVGAGKLNAIGNDGVVRYLADVTDDLETAMSGHRANVTIAAGGDYSVWDGTALTQPGSGRIADVGSVAFSDQYTLLGMRDGREVEWTEVGDPADRNALYFREAEGRDDKIVRIIESGAYVYVFKQQSTEVWGNTQQGGTRAFRRIQGAVVDTGLLAFNLVCRTPAGLFFIGHDKVAYNMDPGGGISPLSTPPVDQALETGEPTHCFYYEDRGHRFCVARFGDRPAWAFDAAMGLWHERSSGVEHRPWDIVCAEFAYGRWHLGSRTGQIYRLGLAPVDANAPMRRTVVSQPAYADGQRFSVAELEIIGEFGKYDVEETAPSFWLDEHGFPIVDEDGEAIVTPDQIVIEKWRRPARMWARFSGDGGNTWSLPWIRDIGHKGEYDATVHFRRVGLYRHFTAEFNLTDPVDVPLLSEGNIEAA